MAVQKRIEYSSGDSYEGEWSSDGKRQGKGRLNTVSGDEYYDEFKNGFFHGLGVLVLSDGGNMKGTLSWDVTLVTVYIQLKTRQNMRYLIHIMIPGFTSFAISRSCYLIHSNCNIMTL